MTTPVQHPASNSESRKRAEAIRGASDAALIDALTTAPSYFVAGDAWGDPVIWRGATNDNCPQPVAGIDGWIVQRDDPELWAVIVAAVEGGVA